MLASVQDCVILGNEIDFSVYSDSNGNIVFFKNFASLENDCGVYCLGHMLPVQDMKLSSLKTHLVTLGMLDQQIIEWELCPHFTEGKHRVVLQGKGFELMKEMEESRIVKSEIDFCKSSD